MEQLFNDIHFGSLATYLLKIINPLTLGQIKWSITQLYGYGPFEQEFPKKIIFLILENAETYFSKDNQVQKTNNLIKLFCS